METPQIAPSTLKRIEKLEAKLDYLRNKIQALKDVRNSIEEEIYNLKPRRPLTEFEKQDKERMDKRIREVLMRPSPFIAELKNGLTPK